MSMVSLTVLMIATFSETAEHASRLLFLKADVGFAACAAIIALAAVMIITANKRITLLKKKGERRRKPIKINFFRVPAYHPVRLGSHTRVP